MSDDEYDDPTKIPTPRDTPLALRTSQELAAVQPTSELSTAYRELLDAIDRYRKLSGEEQDKLVAYITRDRLITLFEMVERRLRSGHW